MSRDTLETLAAFGVLALMVAVFYGLFTLAWTCQ